MASVEQLIIQAIEGDAACQTHFGATPSTRIYPLQLPQSSTFPACTYQRIANTPAKSFDAGGGIDNPLIQIDVWAETRQAAKEAAMEVKRTLENTTLLGIWHVSDSEFLEPDIEPDLFRVSLDFSTWHQET